MVSMLLWWTYMPLIHLPLHSGHVYQQCWRNINIFLQCLGGDFNCCLNNKLGRTCDGKKNIFLICISVSVLKCACVLVTSSEKNGRNIYKFRTTPIYLFIYRLHRSPTQLKKYWSFCQYSPPSYKTQRTSTNLMISDLLVHWKSFHRFQTYCSVSHTHNSGCSLLTRRRVSTETRVQTYTNTHRSAHFLKFHFQDPYGNWIKWVDNDVLISGYKFTQPSF